jgi:hypothetical protein
MNKQIILKYIESQLMPRIGDELHSQLRDLCVEVERMGDAITALGDQIDDLARGETDDDDVADES